MKITVCGMGYVGLVTSVCLAEFGHEVFCVDIDADLIDQLKSGKLPIVEPKLDVFLNKHSEKLHFSNSIDDFVNESSVIFLCVGTPGLENNQVDLQYLQQVCEKIIEQSNSNKTIFIKSTVPPGTADQLKLQYFSSLEHDYELISNPEFLRQGTAIRDFLSPDRIVVGGSRSLNKRLVEEIYQALFLTTDFHYMSHRSAEMSKYVANSFLATKISFINEIYGLSHSLGADIEDVKSAFTADSRINPNFFGQGLGYGGSCLPKDVKALVEIGRSSGIDMPLLEAVDSINDKRVAIVLNRLKESFTGDLEVKTITLWGLSFKGNTDDIRNSPSQELINHLKILGVNLRVYDPSLKGFSSNEVGYKKTKSAMESIIASDALVVATDWDSFGEINMSEVFDLMRGTLLIDGRGLFSKEQMVEIGFDYSGVV